MSLKSMDEIKSVSILANTLQVNGFIKCLILELLMEDLNQNLS